MVVSAVVEVSVLLSVLWPVSWLQAFGTVLKGAVPTALQRSCRKRRLLTASAAMFAAGAGFLGRIYICHEALSHRPLDRQLTFRTILPSDVCCAIIQIKGLAKWRSGRPSRLLSTCPQV